MWLDNNLSNYCGMYMDGEIPFREDAGEAQRAVSERLHAGGAEGPVRPEEYGRHAGRVIVFEGVDNVRDLGGMRTNDGRMVKSGLIYRGGALHGATEADCRKLSQDMGIGCVVDVRCLWECEEKPDAVIEDIQRTYIPFYDKEIVGIEYTEPGYEGKVVSRDVPCTPLLFYRSLVNRLTGVQFGRAVRHVLDRASAGEVTYIHCNGGKDRIGIMSLLILTVLGCTEDDILEDYLLTNISRDKQYPQMFERFYALCSNEDAAHELVMTHRALPEYVSAFYEAIDVEYGCMDVYLSEVLGLDAEYIESVRSACLCDA